ncbi:MAG: hypothetical protein ACPGNV_14295 [Mangrovicoccus sp.]
MPSWPDGIPFCPMGGTYSEEPGDAVLRTEFDAGPAKTRRRFTAVPTSMRFSLPWLSHVEYAQFRAWFEDDLLHGALAFDADHPLTGELRSFRFRQPFRANALGKHMVVQLELEMLP